MLAGLLAIACGSTSPRDAPEADAPEESGAAPAKAKKLPALDGAEAKRAVQAVKSGLEEAWRKIATHALATLEKDRLPASLVETLQGLTRFSPENRNHMLARSFAENITLVDEACGRSGTELMRSLAMMDPERRGAALWDACNLPRHGLIEASAQSDLDPHLALVGHMVFVHLEAGGTISNEERWLLQTMMTRDPSPGPPDE